VTFTFYQIYIVKTPAILSNLDIPLFLRAQSGFDRSSCHFFLLRLSEIC